MVKFVALVFALVVAPSLANVVISTRPLFETAPVISNRPLEIETPVFSNMPAESDVVISNRPLFESAPVISNRPLEIDTPVIGNLPAQTVPEFSHLPAFIPSGDVPNVQTKPLPMPGQEISNLPGSVQQDPCGPCFEYLSTLIKGITGSLAPQTVPIQTRPLF